MPGVPAYQEAPSSVGWTPDYDGVPYFAVHRDASQEYPFDPDLGDSEYISSVSWDSHGPTLSGEASAKQAQGTLTFTGIPSNTDTMVLGDTTITCATSPATVDEFEPGSDSEEAAANLAACINNGSESGNASAVASGSTVIVTWTEYGTGGNAKIFTTSLSNSSVDGSGTLGGTQTGTTVGGIDGKRHVVTATGCGDADLTVTTTSRTLKQRFRWKDISQTERRDYR